MILGVCLGNAAELIPAKTVVLTFDGASKSHRTFVAPLLKELGFGATFFVTRRWMDATNHTMTWEEVAELHQMGFEIGNQSWSHEDFSTPRGASRLAGQTSLVDRQLLLTQAKVPRPTSFAYSANAFGPEAVERLNELGYRLGRRGKMPESRPNSPGIGPAFNPLQHHPLLIPATAEAAPFWNLEYLKRVLDLAIPGKAVVLQFHGVPEAQRPDLSTAPDQFRDYLQFLKQHGFRVIALRDLDRYIDRDRLPKDPTLSLRYPEGSADSLPLPFEIESSRAQAPFWLRNMIVHHRYRWEEAAQVLGWSVEKTKASAARLEIPAGTGSRVTTGLVQVLPYPGGRHPRTGFLDGAIDPQRGTKLSLFPPWENSGYMVLDLPEAIFSNLGLTYLAHTHIPTIWDHQHRVIPNVDWQVLEGGELRSEWKLPNGITFGAQAIPTRDGADFTLWLENGTPARLTALRTQICLMLKGAPGFEEQTAERKEFAAPLAVVKSAQANRYALLAFERCGRAWGNPPCPCIHSDPVLPEALPGQRVSVRGRLRFYEGDQLAEAKARILDGLP